MRGKVIVMKPSDYQAWLSGDLRTSASEPRSTLLEEFRCNNCHAPLDGQVPRGPPLENLMGQQVALQDGQRVVADEDYLRESIMRPAAKVVAGYPPIMPSYEGQTSEAQVLELIREIKSLSPGAVKNQKVTPDRQDVK
jgi:cytochrome c oxidase subunit 2